MTTAEHATGASPALRAQEVEALAKFARYIISEYCWGYSSEPDGGDVQDVAEKLGLIVPSIATVEDTLRIDWAEVGDTIYRFADWLDQPRGLSTPEAPESKEGE